MRDKPWPRWPTWGEAERQRLEQVLASGEWGGFNEFVSEFEEAFAQRHGAKHCIAAANGTLTLEAALRVHGVGAGRRGHRPALHVHRHGQRRAHGGRTPVFVDIEPDTYNLDPVRVREAIGPACKAMIPVHFAGQLADMDALMAIADEHGLAVIEDAAHAHGATWRGTVRRYNRPHRLLQPAAHQEPDGR